MAEFKAKRRSESEIRRAWESDAPIKTAELAIIMCVNRATVQRWVHKGLPRFGSLVRKSSFDKWWNRQARKSGRTRTRPEEKKATAPAKEKPIAKLPAQAAHLGSKVNAQALSGRAARLYALADLD